MPKSSSSTPKSMPIKPAYRRQHHPNRAWTETEIRTLLLEHGLIQVWDEKRDRWRTVMPTLETLGVVRKYLNSLEKPDPYLIPLSIKIVERIIQRLSNQVLGFTISGHSLHTTYVSCSVELEQSLAVVIVNTGDNPATILKYYTKLPEAVMRRLVENRPVILQEPIYEIACVSFGCILYESGISHTTQICANSWGCAYNPKIAERGSNKSNST